jgi:LysM repeat protein
LHAPEPFIADSANDSDLSESPLRRHSDKPGLFLSRRRLISAGLSLLALAATPRVGLAASESASQDAAQNEYVVKNGDTVWDIAVAHRIDPQKLAVANGLAEADFLRIGQRLVIPTDPVAPAPAFDVNQPVANSSVAEAPYRSQFDGSAYAESNCGPASLAMFLGHFGLSVPTATLRASANRQMGFSDPNSGTTWESLAAAARAQGFAQVGLYNSSGGYRRWTVDDLFGADPVACPAMLLVYYRGLPGHETSGYYGDHYILVLGRDSSGAIIFHDPAYRNSNGAYIKMTAAQLDRAWSRTAAGQNRTAMGLQRI